MPTTDRDLSAEHSLAAELVAANRELAGLLHCAPAELLLGADVARTDHLVVCGILGGKDVGKSTLINALARTPVSLDDREVGRGTEEPIAFVHADMQAALAQRLQDLPLAATLRCCPHPAEAIRNVVLIDLPDFDSEFENHVQTVRALAPLLDRVLWVLTPRKLGDRAWVEMLQRVIQDPHNVHCVLNKVDELLKDADPLAGADEQAARRFWQQQRDWAASGITTAGWPDAQPGRSLDENQLFLLAAAFPEPAAFIERIACLWDDPRWQRYNNEKPAITRIARFAGAELDRLRAAVLGPVTGDETQRIKSANWQRSLHVNAGRLRDHYELPQLCTRLMEACEPAYHARLLQDALGSDYCAAVAEAVQQHAQPEATLADDLLDRRVAHWPLLRLVHWPLGWFSRLIGRRLAGRRLPVDIDEPDPTLVEGRPLRARIEQVRSRLLADQADLIARLRLEPQLPGPAELESRTAPPLRGLARTWDRQLIDMIRARDRRPSWFARASLWFILLWFPLLQPLAEAALTLVRPDTGFDFLSAAVKLVQALSAGKLLLGLIAPVAIYVAILAGMYVRAQRDVRRCREAQQEGAPLPDAVGQLLAEHVAVPLLQPFVDRLDRLNAIQTRLHSLTTP